MEPAPAPKANARVIRAAQVKASMLVPFQSLPDKDIIALVRPSCQYLLTIFTIFVIVGIIVGDKRLRLVLGLRKNLVDGLQRSS